MHPLAIQDGSPPGAELLTGAAGPYAGLLFRLYRALLAWTASPDSPPPCDYPAIRRIEDALLARLETDPIAPALAVVCGTLLRGTETDPAEAAWACLTVSDWAIERGDGGTALAFAQLAAWVWPQNARYAWIVARLLFGEGRFREAEPWYRRAHRVAVWSDDWEAQARALNSLGLDHSEQGSFPVAMRYYLRAITVASRRGVKDVEGMATHNLFVLHAQTGEAQSAERYAARAFYLYGSKHPRLPELVEDIAHFWNDRGYYGRTFPVFQMLADRYSTPPASIRVRAGLARAAGGVGKRFEFAASYDEVRRYA
ncbi:MAG TPA: tetratricopeptide repeat protein, partial [Longimicrobiaceae bacterium]|nr:tetratricopeptide repeat protein [Longimicrobiaceae bacterium]